jgi:hypothetical protein
MRADVPMSVNLSAGGERSYTTVSVTTVWQRFTATRTRTSAGTENVFAIIANVGSAAGTLKVRRVGVNLGATANEFIATTTAPALSQRASISVNGSAPVETTGIAYTGAGTTALIPGARDSSGGGQPATGFTSPGIRVAAGQYITGSALQALST